MRERNAMAVEKYRRQSHDILDIPVTTIQYNKKTGRPIRDVARPE